MKLLTKIGTSESSLLIYSFLNLYGKTTPAALRNRTRLSKATIFRNLALLLQANLIKKEVDLSAKDKRYNLSYYITQDLLTKSKALFSEELRNFAITQGKSKVIQEWVAVLGKLPLLLNQFTSQLMLLMRHPSANELANECQKIIKMVAFRLKDVSDFNEVLIALTNFLKQFDSNQPTSQRNWKLPLTKPLALLISAVALNQSEPCEACQKITNHTSNTQKHTYLLGKPANSK